MFSCSVGRVKHCKQISLACVGSSHNVFVTLGLPPSLSMCAFPVYTAQAPDYSALKLSKVVPGLGELPSPKALRFRFSGTPQRHRLGWACVLCPSQVRAVQVTRCLVSAVFPGGTVHLITCPVPAARFSGCSVGVPSQVCCMSLLER